MPMLKYRKREIELQNREKDLVTITKEEYEALKNRDRELSALEAVGVDNWAGYGDHWEYMEEYE